MEIRMELQIERRLKIEPEPEFHVGCTAVRSSPHVLLFTNLN